MVATIPNFHSPSIPSWIAMIHLLVFLHRSLQESLQGFLPMDSSKPTRHVHRWFIDSPFMIINHNCN